MDPGLDDRLRGSAAAAAAQGSGYLLTFDLVIEENLFLAFLNGVSLEGFTLSVGETRIVRNSVLGAMRAGIVCNGLTLPAMSRVDVMSNLLQVLGYGIAVGTDDTRVADNDVFGLVPPRHWDGESAGRLPHPPGRDRTGAERPPGGHGSLPGAGQPAGTHPRQRHRRPHGGQPDPDLAQHDPGHRRRRDHDDGGRVSRVPGHRGQPDLRREPPRRSGERGAGILLQNGTDIAAIGNTIARVGGGAPAGILGHNCLRLRILDNDIGEIGKPEDLGEAFGIVVSGVRVDIQDNAIRRVSDPSAKPSLDTTWWGIMVFGEEPKLAGGEPPPGLTDVPGFVAKTFAIADSLSKFVFDATRGRAIELPRGRPAIAVQGNRVEAVGGANAVYMQTTGSCSFSDNRCFLETRRQTVVKAFAGALVASDNYLEGPQDVPAADFTLPGAAGFTVSGNLSSGPDRAQRQPAAVPLEPAQRSVGRSAHAYCHTRERASRSRSSRPASTSSSGEPSATALRSAGKALRDANPFLRKLSEVPEGTIVLVPELENAKPTGQDRRRSRRPPEGSSSSDYERPPPRPSSCSQPSWRTSSPTRELARRAPVSGGAPPHPARPRGEAPPRRDRRGDQGAHGRGEASRRVPRAGGGAGRAGPRRAVGGFAGRTLGPARGVTPTLVAPYLARSMSSS